MADFPSFLKPVVNQGYSFGGANNLISTEVQGGNPLQRKRFKTGTVPFQIAIVGGRNEKFAFTDWYYGKINGGADKFNMNLDSGRGIEPHVCQIEPGSINWGGEGDPRWIVTFVIIAESTPVQFSDGSFYDLYEEYGDDLSGLLDALAEFTLEHLPAVF